MLVAFDEVVCPAKGNDTALVHGQCFHSSKQPLHLALIGIDIEIGANLYQFGTAVVVCCYKIALMPVMVEIVHAFALAAATHVRNLRSRTMYSIGAEMFAG